MKYYISKKIDATFEQAIDEVKEALGIEGFGVLSEINIHEKLKEKLDVNYRRYVILGACNVVVQELGKNVIEVAAIDPTASMMAIENPKLTKLAAEIKIKLERVIESLHTGVESFGLV
jgi:hypothetical protein